MAEQDFIPWAPDGGNVMSQAAYQALSSLPNGVVSGTASSAQANKTWRQATIMASVIAEFIQQALPSQTVIDDGTTTIILASLTASLAALYGRLASNNTWTGDNTYTQNVTIATGAATINLQGSAGQFRGIVVATGASNVWFTGADTDPQTGGNVGSNYNIGRFSDTGVLIDFPVVINRSTGVVSIGDGITFPTQASSDNSTNGATTAFVATALETKVGFNVVVFDVNGMFDVPSDVTEADVELWGGGGGGGSSLGAPSAASGAGGGGYARSSISVTPGQTIAVTVGAAGTASGGSGNGGSGGTSSFGSSLSATGGGGGIGTNGGFQSVVGTSGQGFGGDLNITAQTGGAGQEAGTTGLSGFGGAAFAGAGASTSPAGGGVGLTPGGGGSGGANGFSGANGGGGLVIVRW
jgi:hypothetical protein